MSKLYTLKEILKQDMKVFEVILNAENPAKGYKLKQKVLAINGKLIWEDVKEPVQITEVMVNASYSEVKRTPVTFEDVLNSDKKCRVEHELINERKYYNLLNEKKKIEFNEEWIQIAWEDYEKGDFLDFENLMLIISYLAEFDDLREIIKEGKWYLED